MTPAGILDPLLLRTDSNFALSGLGQTSGRFFVGYFIARRMFRKCFHDFSAIASAWGLAGFLPGV